MLPYRFCLVLFFYLAAISKYKPPGPYIRRGYLTEGFLRYDLGGLYMEGLIFGILWYLNCHALSIALRDIYLKNVCHAVQVTPGGGGTPLFGLYGDVPLDRVWFFGLAVLRCTI